MVPVLSVAKESPAPAAGTGRCGCAQCFLGSANVHMELTDRGCKEAFVFRVVDVSFSSLSNRARADWKKIQMRVRDRRALPREAACFRDGQIDVGRSAFVCTGGAESELGKGGKYVEGDVS